MADCNKTTIVDPSAECTLNKDVISNREKYSVPILLPDQLAGCTDQFIVFLQKYYEWMSTTGQPSQVLEDSVEQRDLWRASDAYLDLLFKEYGFAWIENKSANRAIIMSLLSDIYKTKGTANSIKILFRALAGEEVDVLLPRNYMLRPSDGIWTRSYYVIGRLDSGTNPELMIGNFVQATTTFPDTEPQIFDVEVMGVVDRGNGYYQLQISKYHDGYFFWDSTISFGDVSFTITSTTGNLFTINDGGSGFRPGDVYDIHNFKVNTCFDYILADSASPLSSDLTDIITRLSTPTVFERQVLVDKKRMRWEKETVTRNYRTDGVIYEEIRRGEHTFIYTAQRGKEKTIHTRTRDDNYTIEVKNVSGYTPGDILVNYDELIKNFYEVVKGNTTDRWWLFWAVDSGLDTAIRGDFNNDGVVDEQDLLLFIRYSLGLSVTNGTLAQDEELIRDRIADALRTVLARDVNPAFIFDPAESTTVKVLETNSDSSLRSIEVITHGYNFPKVGYTWLVPNGAAEVYNLYNNSGYTTLGRFYTDDFLGLIKGTVSYGALPVAAGSYYWKDSKGFLSDIIHLQDGYYYQDFSYVVRTNQTPETGLSWLNETMHPAGFLAFVEQLIERYVSHYHDHITSISKRTHYQLVIEPFLKEYHVEPGYAEIDPTEVVHLIDNEKGLLLEYEYGHMAENVVGIVDWGLIQHYPAAYNTTGYSVDDLYTQSTPTEYRFA